MTSAAVAVAVRNRRLFQGKGFREVQSECVGHEVGLLFAIAVTICGVLGIYLGIANESTVVLVLGILTLCAETIVFIVLCVYAARAEDLLANPQSALERGVSAAYMSEKSSNAEKIGSAVASNPVEEGVSTRSVNLETTGSLAHASAAKKKVTCEKCDGTGKSGLFGPSGMGIYATTCPRCKGAGSELVMFELCPNGKTVKLTTR
jgi:hypothetical protein